MAFLDFNQSLPGLSLSGASGAKPHAALPAFDAQEWRIVRLAQTDGLRSLREPGRLDRLIAFVFGPQPTFKLASDRLEALRRLAVEAWHRGYAVSLSSMDAFRAAGFTVAQLELLLGAIAVGRSARLRLR